ncbi:hypothetical protein ECG_03888 [Echinococcus granulosus]|nr:hypothetical protein ECG_03888 [Echinococcus granulosus]
MNVNIIESLMRTNDNSWPLVIEARRERRPPLIDASEGLILTLKSPVAHSNYFSRLLVRSRQACIGS